MKKDEQDQGSSISSSINPSTDPKQLFDKLLKVQYPMSQDEPSGMTEQPQDSMSPYQARMEALIDKYQNFY